eukprot:CAMPEP_0179034120 /NCGR_PEP_ID=MMETSP0796-20121207/12447_1 /TAXON_ID=73915 /ORGANISM="Pyrodinium bahamense, Strain pbaha01" /LENGTH=96 /DNA_ID=CAMNT_0020730383 /DNA_START=100 /DNA_END=387 /DNA_ORIENTATION=-
MSLCFSRNLRALSGFCSRGRRLATWPTCTLLPSSGSTLKTACTISCSDAFARLLVTCQPWRRCIKAAAAAIKGVTKAAGALAAEGKPGPSFTTHGL